MMTVFFTIFLLNPLFHVTGIVGCAFDKQAIRQDDQEKIYLQESAKVYWDGIRWGIPAKSAVYYENPLVRARWERNPAVPYSRVTEVSILHIEIQNVDGSQTTSPTEISKTAIVYVFVQGIADNNTLQSTEIQQRWYRNGSGWFVFAEEE